MSVNVILSNHILMLSNRIIMLTENIEDVDLDTKKHTYNPTPSVLKSTFTLNCFHKLFALWVLCVQKAPTKQIVCKRFRVKVLYKTEGVLLYL